MTWDQFTSVASFVSSASSILASAIVIISIDYIRRQLIETQRATSAQAYSSAVNWLQSDQVRRARRSVFRDLALKEFINWTETEIESAELVCQSYDTVGQLVRYQLLNQKMIGNNWGTSLNRSWSILAPLVLKYRDEFGDNKYWDDFEWLAMRAADTMSSVDATD